MTRRSRRRGIAGVGIGIGVARRIPSIVVSGTGTTRVVTITGTIGGTWEFVGGGGLDIAWNATALQVRNAFRVIAGHGDMLGSTVTGTGPWTIACKNEALVPTDPGNVTVDGANLV